MYPVTVVRSVGLGASERRCPIVERKHAFDLLSKQIEGLILQSESYGAVQTAVDSLRSELDSLRHHSDSLGTPRAGQATRSPRLAEPTYANLAVVD